MARSRVRSRSRWLSIAAAAAIFAGCSSGATTAPSVAVSAPVVSTAPSSAAPTAAGSAQAGSSLPASPLITKIQAAGVLNAGVAISLPEIGLDPTTNTYFGAGMTLGQDVATALGVKLVTVPNDFATMPAAIQSGKVDLAIAGLFITPVRTAVVDMTPWATEGFCWAVLKTNNKINSLADLNSANVTMAQQTGGGTLQLTQAKYPLAKQLDRLPQPGEDANWPEVISGKADTAPYDSILVSVVAQQFPQFKTIPADCATNPDLASPVGVAYPKGDPGFQQFIQNIIQTNKAQLDADYAKFMSPTYLGQLKQ